MFAYIWPLILVVFSNVMYQICAKGVPNNINPFASLTVTYIVGAISSAAMYFVFNKGGNLFNEFSKLNWAPFIFGFVLVGLEVGWIYVYKAGWQVSTATIVQSSFLAVILIFVGYILYNESLTWNKIVGVTICLIGLIFIQCKS